MQNVTIIGTGLIGASIGLALKAAGCTATIAGFDANSAELETALRMGAVDYALPTHDAAIVSARTADIIVLATPVLPIINWLDQLALVLNSRQLVTDVGSTKFAITEAAHRLGYNHISRAHFLPGHPMAGKETGGAALAEATLFHNAMWLFTPTSPATAIEAEWRSWVTEFGAHTRDLEAARHDELCAWISHLPQFVSTALSALLEARFGSDPETRDQIAAIGGRALRESTRLGASPYSMWRDIALTNTVPIAETLQALEQELTHIRENLRTPELRDAFSSANRFRARKP